MPKDMEQLMQRIQDTYLRVNQHFKTIIDSDPTIARPDSAKGILQLISLIQTIIADVNQFSVEERTRFFNITYNAVVYVTDIAAFLRKSNYAFEVVKQILNSILAMEGNIILQDVKYLDLRTKLYSDICRIYEENQYFEPAVTLLDSAIQKYKQLREIHEMDPPLPKHVEQILTNNQRILKILHLKYSIQSGSVNPNDWKKKVDEEFGDNFILKLMSLIECLRTQTRKQSNIFQKNPHTTITSKTFKQTLVQVGFEMVKPYVDVLGKSLVEQKNKIEREVEFKSTMNLTQQLINQEIKKKRDSEEKFTKEQEYKKASTNFPFEYHAELIHFAFEVKNSKVLENLLEVALIRIECRRIEVPYVNDVGIIAASTSHPNIPNGYEKIPIDLNEANMKIELKKLRKRNEGSKPVQEPVPEPPKDAKKGGKVPPPEEPKQDKKDKDAPTPEQLQKINHKYVFMILKKSLSPENAVHNINIIMGDEESGPAGFMDSRRIIVPYIQEEVDLKESLVKQYKGVKQSTGLVPYIVLKHSKTGLSDEDEMKNILIDVQPLVGKNPICPPRWGYHKIPIDLRQVPEQFARNSNHDYVYITYKTDQLFHIYSRHAKILNALTELQNSYAPSSTTSKIENAQDEKLLQIDITYDLEKLNKFFMTLQECLQGKLGEDYYSGKIDFLTQLVFHVWCKYLRNPLVQFDYINEMRLNEEIVDYDYEFYKRTLNKCKPIFMNGFKIFNFIMANNKNSDILLLSRICLELMKLLQEDQEYQTAHQSGRMCLDRLRIFRDNYLTRGVKGNHDKLLPFSLTCSNIKVKETIEKMQQKFREQRNLVNKLHRIRTRKENHEETLNEDELQEEQDQFLHYQKKDEIDEVIQKVETSHSQLASIVAAIELDIFNIYFRVTLKHSDYLKKKQRISANSVMNGIKESQTIGLAGTTKQKLGMMNTKGEQKNQNNLKQLQTTLIQAEKLPPPKPGLHWLEKKTMEEYQKNPYAFCLLMVNFASANAQSEDKKYFLKEALLKIKQCMKVEDDLCDQAIKNSIFIMSTLWEDEIDPNINSSQLSPFKELYDGTWPCQAAIPDEPILITKNSSMISLKIPPFAPASTGKKKKMIKYMSVYGKPSANGVDVSVNCNQLEGTGNKHALDQIVRVTNLKQNNLYVFAVAPTNSEEQLQPIGKTSTDIPTNHPLPIPMIAAYLAKSSYQINQFQVAEKAAKIVISYFCELSNYHSPDEKINSLYMYRFKEEALAGVSLMEIRAVAESLYIMALCERKHLNQMKEIAQEKLISPILLEEKEQRFTNWLMLAALLNPSLSAPIVSIPFLIPDEHIIFKALSLSLIGQKWMNHNIQELGVKVMNKAMQWGLKKNEIGLIRRILYQWSERKWLMLGKIIQVEEKKDVKKGGKEPKDQEVKMIEKYCRMLIEKGPGNFDVFEDSLATISEEYSDLMSLFIERAKEQITYFTQFVDNPPEELDTMISNLNSKLQLTEYLKDPLNNIKKIPQTSPFYLEYNCKIFKKALEVAATPADFKTLLTKSEELNNPQQLPTEIKNSEQIQKLMMEIISLDIQWIPSAKNDLMQLQEKTGKDLSKQIGIFTDYESKMSQLTNSVAKMDSFINKNTDYDYLNMWISELYYLKATIGLLNCPELKVKNPVKGRFDKIRFMNLQDLLKKKQQCEILDKQSITMTAADLTELSKIMKNLCNAAFHSFMIDNWIKLQNIFKIIYNLFNERLLTPFHHKGEGLWENFAMISLIGVLMLKKIKNYGFEQFKQRYHLKKARTQLKTIAVKLEQPVDQLEVIEVFVPEYYMPELDPNTTKNFWFKKEPRIDIQAISSVIAYSVQCLRIEEKYNLVINLTRDFCNVSQHFYSLQFLPFMIESQQKLIDEVQGSIDKENTELNEIVTEFTKKKNSKMKGERQHKLSNEPLPYEVEFQQKRKKILGSIELLTNHKNYLFSQIAASRAIIEQIKRDTSKTVLKQREQRKYLLEFGDDEEHMFKNYGDDTRLARNRKNAVKDTIEQYDKIYLELKNNKTSKDTLAEIQNRNEVANLHFAAGSIEKASEFWSDALATIFKTVHPVDNYLEIFNERKNFLVNSIGERQSILSLNLLYKISKFGSYQKLYAQHNCVELACKIGFSLFENHGMHPQTLLGHARYRLTKLSHNDILEDETTISLSELLNSLEYFALRAIDSDKSINALPLINLYEHLAVDITKKVELAVRSKIIKAIALANCGLISEAIFYVAKVANEKDLPTLWIESSDHIKRQKGVNWFFEEVSFSNSKSWSDSMNKEAIEYIKKLSLKPQFSNSYGIMNPVLFNYARGVILATIYSQEYHDSYENNEIRINAVQQAEGIMRECLKKIAFLEEHYHNLEGIQKIAIKLKKDELSEETEKQLAKAKSSMQAYLKSNGVEDIAISGYEKQISTPLKRVLRIQFIARIRYSIYKTHLSRRLYANCFYVLKNGLTNMHRYSYGARRVETGNDPQIAPVQPVQQQGGKKDDKKGKKQQEKVQAPQEEVNWQQEKILQKEAEQSGKRISVNIFWHMKLTFELGKLMYQQNRYKTCCQIFGSLIEQGTTYEDYYFTIFAQGFILRSKLRLGAFDSKGFEDLVELSEKKQFMTEDYLNLVMDFGEILGGERGLKYLEKGKKVGERLWSDYGMKSILAWIGAKSPKRIAIKTDELTAEQEQEIKRKNKKAEKKGGKDDKKAAKKEDPKKKKDDTKAEFKVQPLTKYEWWNLLDEDKHSFDHYVQQPHPNFHENNIYTCLPLTYIKCYFRWLSASLDASVDAERLLNSEPGYITKLVAIVETYPYSGYYYHIHSHYCLAELHKKTFISRLHDQILNNNNNNKSKSTKLKIPYDDMPLNAELMKIPAYSKFIFENRGLLFQAEKSNKKLISLLKGGCLLMQNKFKLDEIVYRAAENQLLLAEYRGRFNPKFFPLENSSDAGQEQNLNYLNQVGEAANMLQITIKIMKSTKQLINNYSELGSKPLEASAKIDPDISADILEMDKQFKKNYSKIALDAVKPKQAITSLELVTYLNKIYREAELMTFSNSHIQNIILRVHRGLLSGLPAYKDKCVINQVDFVQKKVLDDTFVQKDSFLFKSIKKENREQFLYILGKVQVQVQGEGEGSNAGIYYGKVNIEMKVLSHILERLYSIKSKMQISEKKSQAVKNRDFQIYKKNLQQTLLILGKNFYPGFYTLPPQICIDLTKENISTLIEMLESGSSCQNREITTYLRHLHEHKYCLRD